jgi:aspartate 1-decarboxylase
MRRSFVRSAIERIRVTRCDPDAADAVAIDRDLLAAADLLPLERVEISNPSRGTQCTTPCLAARPGSGEVALQGGPARLAAAGESVTITSYCQLDREDVPHHRARVVLVDENNRLVEVREHSPFDVPD